MNKTQWLTQALRDYEGRLLRYAKRWADDEAAREIVQEAFLRLWKEDAAALSGREEPWLFCVCRNLALDRLKKEAKVASDPVDPSQIEAPVLPADQKIEREENETRMTQLIRALPPSQQEVIRLKFQEGFSYKQIAEVTGHSVSHVGVLIHEAMKRLKSGPKGGLS